MMSRKQSNEKKEEKKSLPVIKKLSAPYKVSAIESISSSLKTQNNSNNKYQHLIFHLSEKFNTKEDRGKLSKLVSNNQLGKIQVINTKNSLNQSLFIRKNCQI